VPFCLPIAKLKNASFAAAEKEKENEEKSGKKNREAGGQGEFTVGLAARRNASPMSRHNQQRSVEEGHTLLGGIHEMKSVKHSADILEGLSTGVNMEVSAPHLIHKWLNEPRQSPSFML
jgi:hypothetical protein